MERGKRQPLSQADKRCLAALAGILAAVSVCYELTDGASLRAAQEVDKPPVELTWEAPLDQPQLLEAITLQLEPDPYRADVPLDRGLQAALRKACEEHGVPVSLALGLIEAESGFQVDAVSAGGCFGLCQLNPKYFSDDLTPGENIVAGIKFLGELLDKYNGDTQAALTAYNAGYDTGSRTYARAVLDKTEKWGAG